MIKSQAKNTEVMEEIAPNFCEGLKRILSAVYAHTASNVLSSTMGWKILYEGSRFKFSHLTKTIPLSHLIEWVDGSNNLDFKLKKIKKVDDTFEHVVDMFINNIIYRPLELEKLSCYELVSKYELKKGKNKEFDEDENCNVESKISFNLSEEHPSHKYMVMNERKKIVVPSITKTYLIPNIMDLYLDCKNHEDAEVLEKREKYGQIILLLFYPFRIEDDLKLDGSHWKQYVKSMENNLFSKQWLEVI